MNIIRIIIGVVILGLGLIFSGCMRSSTTEALREELHTMKSNAPKASSNELVQSGERAIEISDASAEANELANDGVEQLSVSALEESLMFFEMALKKDRGNEKALFYLSLLRPFRPLRGVYFQLLPSENQLVDFNVFVGDGFFHDDSPEYGLVRFMGTPSGEKVKNYREGFHKFVFPFIKEVQASLNDLALLLTNPEIELSVTLPKDLALLKDARVRNADIRMLRSFYLYMYIVTRIMVSYEATSFPASDINSILPEARLKLDLADPAFGILTDPTVFRVLKDNSIELMAAVEKAATDLKVRYAKRTNTKEDLFQANMRQVLMCQKYQDLPEALEFARMTQKSSGGTSQANLSVIPDGSANSTVSTTPPNPVCLYSETVTTPLLITTYGSSARHFFEDSFDGQSLQRWEEVQRFQEVVEFGDGPQTFEPMFKLMREYLNGPVETKYTCVDVDGKKVEDRLFVDFSSFAEHPVRDLKSLRPLFIGGSSLENVYQVTDPTLGGLFRPHLPCYKINQELAKQTKIKQNKKPGIQK